MDYVDVIGKNTLFKGLSRDEIEKNVVEMGGMVREYRKGEILHEAGRAFSSFGLVLEGVVAACCDDLEGNRMIMAEVLCGQTFGEALYCIGEADNKVYVAAIENAVVIWLKIIPTLEERFKKLLAERTLSMNRRIQVLSKKTIREKILTYFGEIAGENGDNNEFTIPLNREDLAAYIGADRTALSRELTKMQKDGLLEFRKNRFRILISKKV